MIEEKTQWIELCELLGADYALHLAIIYEGKVLVPKNRHGTSYSTLLRVLGEEKTLLLVNHFEGELLQLPTGRHKASKIKHKRIIELTLQGLPRSEIALLFNCSTDCIDYVTKGITRGQQSLFDTQ